MRPRLLTEPQQNPRGAFRGRRSVLPPAADLADMIVAGATAESIAADFGVAPTTVDAHLKHGGYHPRTGQPRDNPTDVDPTPPAVVFPGSWVADGLCAQVDADMFFPEKGGSTREAKQVCARCPVTSECLDYALANNEHFGIWGGTSERERRTLGGHTALRTCPECQAEFEVPTGANSVTYCGAECRRAARRRSQNESQARRRPA